MRSVLSCLLAAFAVTVAAAPDASASHFRYGTLQWAPTAVSGEVRFDLRVALRRNALAYGNFPNGIDQFAETGDIITENVGATNFAFGDGGITPTLRMIVTDFSVTENWIIALALQPGTDSPGILHAYGGPGPYTARMASCCRLSPPDLNNRADGPYLLETVVRPLAGNRSPVSSLVPIVVLPASATATFLVPASDPDGNPIRWRMSTDAEAGGGPHPANININPTTGQVTWNNLGLNQSRFWTTQVVIEDLDANGAVKTKTPVDFLLKIIPQQGVSPTCSVTPPGPFTVSPGTLVSFTLTGTDPDPGEVIILNGSSVPVGATMTPNLPTSGPTGVSSVFAWTPTAGEEGTHVISFSATDRAGQQGLCSATIIVVVNSPPTITCPAPVTLNCTSPQGTPHTLTAHVEDLDGDALVVTWRVNGVVVEVDNVPSGGTTTSADVTLIRNWPLGTSNVQVEVSDGEAAAVSCTTTVTVVDTTPPVVTCSVLQSLLWPPNHNMINVGLTATSSDTCGTGGNALVEVWGDEDDEMPTGDGNHAPDALNIASGTLRLRSERRGDADGRVYLILGKARDGGGNVGTRCCTVVVPHSPNPTSVADVRAQAAAAQATCDATGAAPAGYYVIGDGDPHGPKQFVEPGATAARPTGTRPRSGRAAKTAGNARRRN